MARRRNAVPTLRFAVLTLSAAAFVAVVGWLAVLGKYLYIDPNTQREDMSFVPRRPTRQLDGMAVGPGAKRGALTKGVYTAALAMLRCLTTPGCFPRRSCQVGSPMKIKRKMKFEEQSFCVENLKATRDRCLVYSVGILDAKAEWESKVARLFGCEVHAFDPTMDHPSTLAPGVSFHKLGLQGEGTNMSATHASHYKPIDPTLLLQLDEIMTRLGHANRTLDVLMLDCEGCEWGVLKQLARSGNSDRVKQIVTEFHFQKALGLFDESDVLVAAEAARCLWEERWSIVSMEGSGAGRADWEYARGITQVLPSAGFLMYLALQRTPEGEDLPSDILATDARAQRLKYVTHAAFKREHGKNETLWPQEVRSKMSSLNAEADRARTQLRKVQFKVQLDSHPRMEEPDQ